MKIEKISDTQIKVTLNHSDLMDRDLKLSELAYGSQKAQALFKDMMAKIDSIDLKEQKLTVLVDLFGQETSVEVDMQEVETLG